MNEIDVLFKEAAEKAAVGPPPSVQRLASAARRTRRKAHAVVGLSCLAVAGVAIAATTQLSHAGSETREETPVVAAGDGLDCPSQERQMVTIDSVAFYPTIHEAVAGMLGPGESASKAGETATSATVEIHASDGTTRAIVELAHTRSGWTASTVRSCPGGPLGGE